MMNLIISWFFDSFTIVKLSYLPASFLPSSLLFLVFNSTKYFETPMQKTFPWRKRAEHYVKSSWLRKTAVVKHKCFHVSYWGKKRNHRHSCGGCTMSLQVTSWTKRLLFYRWFCLAAGKFSLLWGRESSQASSPLMFSC